MQVKKLRRKVVEQDGFQFKGNTNETAAQLKKWGAYFVTIHYPDGREVIAIRGDMGEIRLVEDDYLVHKGNGKVSVKKPTEVETEFEEV